jgi:hypothetical protein
MPVAKTELLDLLHVFLSFRRWIMQIFHKNSAWKYFNCISWWRDVGLLKRTWMAPERSALAVGNHSAGLRAL